MGSGLLAGWPIVFLIHNLSYLPDSPPVFSVSVIVKILISNTKCSIERTDFFVVLKAEVFSGEFNRISGLVGVHIDL